MSGYSVRSTGYEFEEFRNSNPGSHLFDERNDAVKSLIHMAISECPAVGKYVGICDQGPSDHLDLAKWLLDEGIESVSLNPNTVIQTWLDLANN